ncbi:MAG: hypothetical protein L6R38_009679, partial [Xanthoria sp. 2 TBL-2021]
MPGVRKYSLFLLDPNSHSHQRSLKAISQTFQLTVFPSAPDALAQVKRGLRSLFGRKKRQQQQQQEEAQQQKPTQTSNATPTITTTAPPAAAAAAATVPGSTSGHEAQAPKT